MLQGISIWQLLILLAIVILVFGTKRLKGVGSDLGGAIRGFRKGLDEDEKSDDKQTSQIADDKPVAGNESRETSKSDSVNIP